MNRTAPSHTDAIWRIVSEAIVDAGRLTGDLLEYVETTLFPPEPGPLTAFLKDADSSDRDSLLDLIFYPDEALQIRLEPRLMHVDDAQSVFCEVRERLMAAPLDAVIRMPDGTRLTEIRLPGFIKTQFLDRLNLAWQLDADLAAAISNGVGDARIAPVRVRLRNSRQRLNEGARRFLCRFFERMDDAASDYTACLDLVLALIGGLADDRDAYDLLVAHKRSLFRSLQQARRFETLLRTSNMETLMLQGVRAPHASCDALLDEMRLIDRICMAVFGRTEPLDPPMEEPLRQVTDLDDPAAAVRSLWR